MMQGSLKGKHFLTLEDFTPEELRYLLDLSIRLKKEKKEGRDQRKNTGKNMLMLFEMESTRTRCSFETSAQDLGMGTTYLSNSHFGTKETIKDSMRVFSAMYDVIAYRGKEHSQLLEMAKDSTIPIINGYTMHEHPTQMLADILTVKEEFGDVRGRKLTFFGDARNNVANSLMVVCAKLGMRFCACGPKELMPAADLVEKCKAIAAETGAEIELTDDVKQGAKDCDVLYTDIWVSMGEPAELWEKRIKLLLPYQVNKDVMAMAKPTAIFLHCLPSFHDRDTTTGEEIFQKFGLPAMEVTDDVFLGKQARQFDEAENRMHTIKAVMYATLK